MDTRVLSPTTSHLPGLVPAVRPESIAALPVARSVAIWSDDPAALNLLRLGLREEGLRAVALALDGGALDAEGGAVDAVLMQVTRSLPEHLAGLRALRVRWPLVPLVVVCRGLRELDHVLALEMGADDVLELEWSSAVVAARLRAQWRSAAQRRTAPPVSDELHFGALCLRLRERSAVQAGRTVALTEGEFEVLWLLASHAGSALSRRDILRQVRGLDDHLLDRSIDSRVYRLRAKLGDSDSARQRIRTVRNRGYVFSPVGW